MKVVMWICSVDGTLVQINDGLIRYAVYVPNVHRKGA